MNINVIKYYLTLEGQKYIDVSLRGQSLENSEYSVI